jgi:transposase
VVPAGSSAHRLSCSAAILAAVRQKLHLSDLFKNPEPALWLRHQPQSALAVWYRERIKRKGGRLGKTMIVALARKLLVALWKYATAGVLIEGAILKQA